MISTESVGVVRYLRRLPTDPIKKMQVYHHLASGDDIDDETDEDWRSIDEPYSVMTHYIVVGRTGYENPASRIAALVEATKCVNKKEHGAGDHADMWIVVTDSNGESTWELVTDEARVKPREIYWPRHFRHIKDGEHIYFVYRSPIPPGVKVKPLEFEANYD